MVRHWTFGKNVGVGFAAIVVLSISIGFVSMNALRGVVSVNQRMAEVNLPTLMDAERLETSFERKVGQARGYLLTRNESMLDLMRTARSELLVLLERLERNVLTEDGRRLLAEIRQAEAGHQQAIDRLIELRRGNTPVEQIASAFEQEVLPLRVKAEDSLRDFVAREDAQLQKEKELAVESASAAVRNVAMIVVAVVVLAAIVAVVLTKTLGRKIGTAVGQVQSSSSELQAAANQQASGARQHATAMNEISTTISELLATSRQIADSSQRVVSIAEETAGAAKSGDSTVHVASDAILGIRHQVDLVTNHMLELGKKSQQIGSILEMVTELAEQTNILAINATIEAAGAGDSGKRFTIVADEIRKLADRVTTSAKEIRNLIEDVRAAVNTTVMATETGSKTVDSGMRQFSEVTTAFKRITDLVATTTEAAREIELSTKQQSTAVEQVNLAIANVAQATKESEASSTQTLQTASELASLSKDLLLLVEPQPV